MLGPRGWDSVVVAHLLVQALKLPLAASVLVDLVPPPKTHEEPPAHVLNLQKGSEREGRENAFWLGEFWFSEETIGGRWNTHRPEVGRQ